MNERINKPKVFLSHSSKDKDFIEKLADDLRKCQIDTWLDTEEIRDGKSWLSVIFEDGIPTCDVVIVYFTNNSLKSKIVSKEIDTALIQNMNESNIAFLPYVQRSSLRKNLRSDLQTLQCREWNNRNYHEVLPSVVSEIWRSYLEKNASLLLLKEKNRSLKLELELKNLQERYQEQVFTPSESVDFQFIYKTFNQKFEFIMNEIILKEGEKTETLKVHRFKISFLETIIHYMNKGFSFFDFHYFRHEIFQILISKGFLQKDKNQQYRFSNFNEKVMFDLKVYGLIKTIDIVGSNNRTEFKNIFTDKMHRFIYWLNYNKIWDENINIEVL